MLQRFPIIGIGASAGGIDALKVFFRALPPTPGAAFVVVVHMPPQHRTLLAEVLSSLTSMPVAIAIEGAEIEPGHVYVSPAEAYLTLADGRFSLMDSLGESLHLPIDRVFETLAEWAGNLAIGVVLSGSGSDGAGGARAIALAGGQIFAQAPETAIHDSMPRHAAAAVESCRTAPPDRLAGEISEAVGKADSVPTAAMLGRILTLVRQGTGRDFGGYKPRTLLRRIARRMDTLRLASPQDYASRLEDDPAEAATLADFMVIGVTEFFRDQEVFTILGGQALPTLLRSRGPGGKLRAWVAGCSTGEEAYSLAILLLELSEALATPWEIKVFATDIDVTSVEYARAGLYDGQALQGVSADRLARFFERQPDGYRIAKVVRDCVVFSIHNLLSDPPFSHLDLISCRNVLIYLDAASQASILPRFHYALNPGGLLLLGPSETVGRIDYAFEALSKKWRIFRKLPVKLPFRLDPLNELSNALGPLRVIPRKPGPSGSIGQMIADTLAADFAPAAVAVDRGGHIIHYCGPIERFLALPTGAADHSLAAMVRSGLRRTVRRLFQSVWEAEDGQPIHSRATLRGPDASMVRVSAKLIGGGDGPLAILVFEDCGPALPPHILEPDDKELRVRELELELGDVRNDLHAYVDALTTSNEELRTLNEEVLSTNEELQATNEELETSKEEILSVNEELTSVNVQLGVKVDQLAKANDDMTNLLACTDVATVFLDRQGLIRHYTPMATKLFHLIPSDLGRPLTDLVWQFEDPRLLGDIAMVLDKLTPTEAVARTGDDAYFIRKVVPYRSGDDHIGGVVLTFIDVSAMKLAEAKLEEARHLAEQTSAEKSRLLAALGHDLRQPLQALRLLLEVWRGTAEGAMKAVVGHMNEALHVAETQLSLLMDVSSVETGRVQAHFGHFQLDTVLSAVAATCAPEAAAKGIILRSVPTRTVVHGDRALLERMLLNLTINAVRHTASGKVLVGCRRRSGHLYIEVWDTGPGIPLDQQAAIFEDFYQLGNPERDRRKGYGLGLSIVNRLAKLLCYTVTVRSIEGKGSVFTICIHLGESKPPPPVKARA